MTDGRLVRTLAATAAFAALAAGASLIRERAGDYIYGEADNNLAAVLLDAARQRRVRIAVAESCTGGLLGKRHTDVPGSSDVFVGGVIAYEQDVYVQLGESETLYQHLSGDTESNCFVPVFGPDTVHTVQFSNPQALVDALAGSKNCHYPGD